MQFLSFCLHNAWWPINRTFDFFKYFRKEGKNRNRPILFTNLLFSCGVSNSLCGAENAEADLYRATILDVIAFTRSLCDQFTQRAADCNRTDRTIFLVDGKSGCATEHRLHDDWNTACQTQACKLRQSTQKTLTCSAR